MSSAREHRVPLLRMGLALVVVICASWVARAADSPTVQLNAASAAPRQVEDATEKAIVRDYTKAWTSLATALDANRADVLSADFVGFAQDELRKRVTDQQKSGLHTRYVDHGHKLQAIFYSPEGSAMELRDTAQLEQQILVGDKVISSESITQNYVVVMTPAANRWQVRVLQPVAQQ